jgi:hypothetical protein
MKKSMLLASGGIVFVLSFSIWNISTTTYAQITNTTSSSSETASGSEKSIVSINAKMTVQISNDTVKTKEAMLRTAVVGFLNSGSNILKTSDAGQLITKTKITNEINNTTQSLEGAEATNAVFGVEISKALKSAVSSSNAPGQMHTITVETSSTCKPSDTKSTTCENTIGIK